MNRIATNLLKHLWLKYESLVENTIGDVNTDRSDKLRYWKENLFAKCIIYCLPASLVALLPSVIIKLQNGFIFLPVFDIFVLLSIAFVTLTRFFNLDFKKAYVVTLLYLLAIFSMLLLGSFGIGSIYVLAVSVFISLMYPTGIAYRSVVVNAFIYGLLAFVIYHKLIDVALTKNYPIGYWIIFSSNLLFLNAAVVILIRYVITGLEATVVQEAKLLKQLRTEFREKVHRNKLLKESEGHYKSLFFSNPTPMWIFDNDTLRFLQVNDAAIRKYGYSEEEFLSMTLKDIRPTEHINELLDALKQSGESGGEAVLVTRHRRKNGDVFYAEVRCNTIPFKGKPARLAISRNVTAHIEHTQAIERQNRKLKEIAYMQSHGVRAPLARIIALTNILITENSHDHDNEILNYLDVSVNELDDVIKSVVHSSSEAGSITPYRSSID